MAASVRRALGGTLGLEVTMRQVFAGIVFFVGLVLLGSGGSLSSQTGRQAVVLTSCGAFLLAAAWIANGLRGRPPSA